MGLALGLAGPLISGPGAAGYALQNLISNTDDLESLLLNLLEGTSNLIDGLTNGGYGPNLASLLTPAAMRAFTAPLAILAGGLIGPGNVLHDGALDLPGTIPTIQGFINLLLGPDIETVNSFALIEEENRPIEDGVNGLLYAATAVTLRLVTLAAPLLEPILGEEAAGFLALGALGLLGPLISGTGAAGHAVQDLFNSEDLAGFLDNTLDLVRLPIDGTVNGGFGPNLAPLVGGYIPTPLPILDLKAGGLINQVVLDPVIEFDPSHPIGLAGKFQGTIPTLQGLVTQVFGLLPVNEMASEFRAPADGTNVEISGLGDDDQGNSDDDKVVDHKRNRPLLNVLKLNPLDLGTKKEAKDADGTSGKHRFGTPVRDVINKVLGLDDDDDDGGVDASE